MRLILAGLLLLAGCMTTAEPVTSAKCDTAPLAPLIGQAGTAELAAEGLKLSGARALRWKQPGAMFTMDYRPDRLNASLDTQNRVIGFDCG